MSIFIEMLKNESWDNNLNNNDVNESFILFLNTFLIIFESCFPMQYVTNNVPNNYWVTTGIKISCQRKKLLYIMSKTTNCFKIKVHYTQYCIVLWNVTRKAIEMYHNELSSSTNKSKMSWNITNNEIGTASNKKFIRLNLNLVTNI